ncbi:hypothetical protein B0J17DRAFT_722749 [Rhizoctonia solani]|nr:hypothetical protein B0J17DRAFT_722749 [Rhizoctonia solani]
MADIPPRRTPHQWEQCIKNYPRLYSQEALSVHLKAPINDAKRAMAQEVALSAIQKICMLGDPNLSTYAIDSIINSITLITLECILETARFPGELVSFALPKLVAGCIVLMSSLKSSLFHYQYGYMCFKIMVIALNTCLLKHGCRSGEFVGVVIKDSPKDCISAFGPRASNPAALPPWIVTFLEKPKLDMLLALLDADQKNFTIALKGSNSLALSGLMYVASYNSQLTKAKKLLLPFTGIFCRYRLVVPNIPLELEALTALCFPEPDIVLQSRRFIELEDSRNVVQAYTEYLESSVDADLLECANLLIFIKPLMVSGCEDLICDMFDAAMQVL